MSEIVIKKLEAIEETQVGDDTYFAHYLHVEGEGAPDNGKVRVLAKSEGKWGVGAKALCEVVKTGYGGPDGEQDWAYCKLKNPEGFKGRGGGGGNSRSFGRSGSGTTRTAAGGTSQPMPTVSFSEASQAYDDFASAAAIEVSETMDSLLTHFGEAKPTPDAILAAAVRLTTAKANSLFAAYIKSFRVAYQAKGE